MCPIQTKFEGPLSAATWILSTLDPLSQCPTGNFFLSGVHRHFFTKHFFLTRHLVQAGISRWSLQSRHSDSHMSIQDYVSCVVREGGVGMTLPSGILVDVPSELLQRSTTLRDAIPTDEVGIVVQIVAPQGFIESWLQCTAVFEPGASAANREAWKGHALKKLLRHLKVRVHVSCIACQLECHCVEARTTRYCSNHSNIESMRKQRGCV